MIVICDSFPLRYKQDTQQITDLQGCQVGLYVLDSEAAKTVHMSWLEMHCCICEGMFHIRNWHGIRDRRAGESHRIFLLVVVQDYSHLIAQLLLTQDSHITQSCRFLADFFACGGNWNQMNQNVVPFYWQNSYNGTNNGYYLILCIFMKMGVFCSHVSPQKIAEEFGLQIYFIMQC